MAKQFYRKALASATLLCSATLTLAQIGQPKPKPRTGPRAVSVLEMDAKGHARMVPVTILYQDHWYDAAQYQSNPVPMALEAGNVYDVLQSNTPIGLFTTGEAQQTHGEWVALGKFKEKTAEKDEKPAKVEVTVKDNDSDAPVLKRHKGSDSASSSDTKSAGSSSSSPKSGEDDPDRPTLKRPEAEKESAPAAAADNTATPTIAKRSAAPVDQDLTKDTNENDPDRPVLRKTPVGVNPTNASVTMTPPIGSDKAHAPAKIAAAPGAEQFKEYIAISDEQKTEYRPFAYDLKPEEKVPIAQKFQKIAGPALQKWALAHGGVKLPATVTFTDYTVRAFDVDYSNNPEVVFTASYSPPTTGAAKTKLPIYYVTLVGRVDGTGEVTPLFSQITDNTRLDAYSRLELVDAVDADGYGRGSLLFREYTDSGKAFVLYRVDAYNLTKLFEGASGQ